MGNVYIDGQIDISASIVASPQAKITLYVSILRNDVLILESDYPGDLGFLGEVRLGVGANSYSSANWTIDDVVSVIEL